MSSRPTNAFLRSLGEYSFAALEPHLTRVELRHAASVQQPEERVEQVWFPETSLISVLTTTAEGETVETTMCGNEGAFGVLEACGSGLSGVTAVVQIDGSAWRAPAAAVRSLALSDEDFGRRCWSLVEFQMAESRQSGMCQALHSVEARLARWLVESAERAGGRDPMPLTQEFIAAMLGVQRTTVTAFAGQLQKAGLIRYTRGQVEITDLEGLEARACECRQALHHQRRRLRLDPLPALSGLARSAS